MSSGHSFSLPTRSRQAPPRAHTRTRMSRVQDSLTSRFAKFICSVVLTLILIAGLILFILWLSLRPHRPRFYLSSFSFPGLVPAGQFSFNVSDRNSNQKIGVYYDSMDGSVFYMDRRVGGGQILYPFYQPPKNTSVVQAVLGSVVGQGDPLWIRIQADGRDGRVGFRLELRSTIRFKVKIWDTHAHEMHVSCDVEVGSDGNMLAEYKNRMCSVYFG